MFAAERLKYLRVALVVVGLVCLALYPLMLVWPSGWTWHTGHLLGDVPALGVAAIVLAALTPRGENARAASRPVA